MEISIICYIHFNRSNIVNIRSLFIFCFMLLMKTILRFFLRHFFLLQSDRWLMITWYLNLQMSSNDHFFIVEFKNIDSMFWMIFKWKKKGLQTTINYCYYYYNISFRKYSMYIAKHSCVYYLYNQKSKPLGELIVSKNINYSYCLLHNMIQMKISISLNFHYDIKVKALFQMQRLSLFTEHMCYFLNVVWHIIYICYDICYITIY